MIFNWQTLRRSRDPAHFELSCKSAGGVVAAAVADADAVDVALFFGAVVNPSMPQVNQTFGTLCVTRALPPRVKPLAHRR